MLSKLKELFKSSLNKTESTLKSSNKESPVPNINLTFPSYLPTCQEITLENHKDPRVIVRCMQKFGNHSFTSENFNEYDSADVGNIDVMLEMLEERNWVKEKSPIEILISLYTVNELKTFLATHNLKMSGKKEDLAKRLLENVPFKKFKRKYKHKLYGLTEVGLKIIEEKETDYNQAIINAVNAIKIKNFQGAVDAYNAFDDKWGFIHGSGRPHTIFANYEVPHGRFIYITLYPMKELQNSDTYKQDLRAFLISSLMRHKQDRSILAKEFLLINQEPIRCPDIINFYRQNRDDTDKKELERILVGMQERIEREPDCVLQYYISKILYHCKYIYG